MSEKLIVGIADMKIAKKEGQLITYALGSCIGVCLYDPEIKLAALLHIMLPLNMEAGKTNPLKYADTGIKETLRGMELRGAVRSRIVAKIAGGACIFSTLQKGTFGNIGQRNIESVRMILKMQNIKLLWEDVGGNIARSVFFDAATGKGMVRSHGQPEKVF